MTNMKKILIAEDEKAIGHAMDLKLKSKGFTTKVVSNGQLALDALKSESFDLMLLDLIMPGIDGFGVLSKLKEENNNTPVFVMSNLGQEDDVKKAKSLGAKAYFVKSNMTLADMIDKVTNFLKI
jgi:DNA-binding response OmpR family regulator